MSEEEIIDAICRGGREMDQAVKALYQSLAAPMLRFFVHHGVPGTDAEDMFQDTVVKVLRNAAGFRGTGPARAWMWQIARNCLLDYLDKRSRLGAHEVQFDPDAWEKLVETTAALDDGSNAEGVRKCVRAGLWRFGQEMPDRAYALTLYVEEVTIEEISHRLDRTIAATKEYLSQCRKKLKPFIANCMELLED